MQMFRSIDMADHDSIVSSDKLEAIADAIREKTHKDNLMTLDEMPDEIASISGGGGNVPECGIVPTRWSSVGYVLSADIYGDVVEFACGLDNYASDYDPDNHHSGYSDQGSLNQYTYLTNISFRSTTETIYRDAFSNCIWMQLDALPEGLVEIQQNSFYYCSNVILQEIPASVETIGNYAFYYSNHPENVCMPYSNTSTYTVGDVVKYQDYTYTCLSDIEEPEEFDNAHWIEGYYPELIGIYDPNASYSDGDIVYDAGYVCTTYIENVHIPDIWADSYCPDVIGMYDSTHTYNAGDTVYYYDDEDLGRSGVYTSLVDNNPWDGGAWIDGYYPGLLGKYDSSVEYHLGDVICDGEGSDTYVYTAAKTCQGVDPYFDPTGSWISGYCPNILGPYSSSQTYNIGDVISFEVSDGAYPYTCIIPVTSPEEFDADKWISGHYPQVMGIYDENAEYAIGDIVMGVGDYYGVYTAVQPSVGQLPWESNGCWTVGYYPDLLGPYDDHQTYNVGDVVYKDSDEEVYTFIQSGQITPTVQLLNEYCPSLLGIYDPSRTYNPCDVVLHNYSGSEYSSGDISICISATPVTGDWNSSYWDSYFFQSISQYVVHPLIFRGTPQSIGIDAFSGSGYNVALVPWSEYSGPDISSDFNLVIYNYIPNNQT